jgi:hypothetical protein
MGMRIGDIEFATRRSARLLLALLLATFGIQRA